MVKRCVVGGCSNSTADKVSVHLFRKDNPSQRRKWDAFVKTTRKDWKGASDYSVICGAHFKAPDDFIEWHMYQAGFKRQLALVKGAVPSIRPILPTSRLSAQGRATPSADDTPVPKKRRKSGAARKLSVARVSIQFQLFVHDVNQ